MKTSVNQIARRHLGGWRVLLIFLAFSSPHCSWEDRGRLDGLIEGLRRQGYSFRRIDELLAGEPQRSGRDIE